VDGGEIRCAALAPLIYGGSGPVDYYAHSAGAITGATVGWLLSAIWAPDHHRPLFTREAAIGSLVGVAASLAACGFAATQYSAHSERAAQFILSSDIAGDFKFNVEQSSDLVTRYPKDPRSHLARAISMARANDRSNAESELRTAISLASSNPAMQPVKNAAQALLAVIIASEGRRKRGQGDGRRSLPRAQQGESPARRCSRRIQILRLTGRRRSIAARSSFAPGLNCRRR
jgi:rhomboid protease GluP